MATDRPFLCYRELLPPNNVACAAFFRGDGSRTNEYLLTASVSVLRVYRVQRSVERGLPCLELCSVVPIYARPFDVKVIPAHDSERLCTEIILSCDEGKILCLQFDEYRETLFETALYNVEENAFGVGAELKVDSGGALIFPANGKEPYLAIDPAKQLVCALVYSTKLLFIPLKRKVSDTSSNKAIPRFLIDMMENLLLPGSVVDICFLTGYTHPTIAVLQESPLPIGHAARVLHTSILTVLAIDVLKQSASILWQRKHLPHDSIQLINMAHALDSSLKCGVIVVSVNALIACSFDDCCVLSANSFASITTHTTLYQNHGNSKLQPWPLSEGVEFDGSRWCVLDSDTLVSTLRDGQLFAFHLHTKGVTADTDQRMSTFNVKFEVELLGNSVCSSVLATNFSDLLFLGSSFTDSLLFYISKKRRRASSLGIRDVDSALWSALNNNSMTVHSLHAVASSSSVKQEPILPSSPPPAVPSTSTPQPSTGKRLRKVPRSTQRGDSVSGIADREVSIPNAIAQDILSEECKLYGDEQRHSLPREGEKTQFVREGNGASAKYFNIEIVDALESLGPINTGVFTQSDTQIDQINDINWQNSALAGQRTVKPNAMTAAQIPQQYAKETLLMASGFGETSAVNKLTQGFEMHKISSKEVANANNVICLPISQYLSAEKCSAAMSILLVSLVDSCQVYLLREQHLSGQTAAAALDETGELFLTEISADVSGFVHTDAVVAAGVVFVSDDSVVIAQIFSGGVRIIQVSPLSSHPSGSVEENPDVLAFSALQDVLVCDDLDMGGLGCAEGSTIRAGDICEGCILLLSSNHNVFILEFDHDEQIVKVVHSTDFDGISDRSENLLQNALIRPPRCASLYFGAVPTCLAQSTNHNCDVSQNIVGSSSSLPTTCEDEFLYGPDASDSSFLKTKLAATPMKLRPANNDVGDMQYGDIYATSFGSPGVAMQDGGGAAKKARTECTINSDTEDQAPQHYIVIVDCCDIVTIVSLQSMKRVFSSPKLVQQIDCVELKDDIADYGDDSPHLSTGDRFACDILLTNIGPARVSPLLPPSLPLVRLALVLLYSTGEVGIYYSTLNKSATNANAKSCFIKYEFSTASMYIHPKARIQQQFNIGGTVLDTASPRLIRGNSMDVSVDTPTTPSRAPSVGGSSDNYGNCSVTDPVPSLAFSLRRSPALYGYEGVLIPGSCPSLLTASRGFPFLVSIGLPELPYSNYGRYAIAPFVLASRSVSTSASEAMHGVCTLWQEFVPSQSSLTRSIFGMYRAPSAAASNVALFPNAAITAKRIPARATIKHMSELLPKSDDKTELALLQKKIFVISVENNVLTPFLPKVLTKAELEKEEQSYDRFIGSLDSFGQPLDDASLAVLASSQSVPTALGHAQFGPVPRLQNQEHKVCLVVAGKVVDEYVLPLNEHVLGMEVLYLTIEKKPDAAVANAVNMAVGRKLVTSEFVRRVFVAACTHVVDKHGEDTQGEGRLLLFSLDYKVLDSSSASDDQDEDGVKLSAQDQFLHSLSPKLRLQWQGPGPASVVKQFGEKIISTVGASVYIYKLNPETLALDQISFYFGQYYISSVSVVRNYIMLCDVCNSIQFLVWREDDYSLTPLSRDFDKHICLSSSYIWDGNSLGIVHGDNEANVQMMQFNPKKIESIQGSRLLPLADFHIGSDCNVMLSHVIPVPALPMNPQQQAAAAAAAASQAAAQAAMMSQPTNGQMPSYHHQNAIPAQLPMHMPSMFLGSERSMMPSLQLPSSSDSLANTASAAPSVAFGTMMDKQTSNKSSIVLGTADGSLGLLIPVEEKIYRRLALLQQLMLIGTRTKLSFNAKDFRIAKRSFQVRIRSYKSNAVLDGTLLWRYPCLELQLQEELAIVIGTSRDVILENLNRLDKSCAFF